MWKGRNPLAEGFQQVGSLLWAAGPASLWMCLHHWVDAPLVLGVVW